MNKEISEKNSVVTELLGIVNELKLKKAALDFNERAIRQKVEEEDTLMQTIDVKSQVLIEENSNLFKSIMDKHKILKSFCTFMTDYDRQLSKLIFKMQDIKNSKLRKSKNNQGLFDDVITCYNTDFNITTINQITEWNKSDSNNIVIKLG